MADMGSMMLLRPRCEGPGGSGAAEQRDERAAPHSITSSARASSARRHGETESPCGTRDVSLPDARPRPSRRATLLESRGRPFIGTGMMAKTPSFWSLPIFSNQQIEAASA